MSVFDEFNTEIQHYETLLGRRRGRLAVALDRLTTAQLEVGQHAVYCRRTADPEEPSLDIQEITRELRYAKELIQNVMEELREASSASGNAAPRLPLL